MSAQANLLRRIARAPAPAPSLTPARALRLAMTRAAERSISLPLAVLGISEEEGPLDDLLSRLEEGLLLVALAEDEGPVGLVALDAEARAAVIESQALGRPVAASPDPRPVTAADLALARPLLSTFLAEVEEATSGTSLAGWLRSPALAARLPGAREAMMHLPDGPYRVVRLTLDLGAGGRQGLLVLMHRLPPEPSSAPPEDAAPATVATQALQAQAELRAVLHRLRLPLEAAEALEVGQVLPLPGITVASIRIEAGSQDLGPARLGQVAGMRAVRLESPLAPQLAALPALREADGPLLPGPDR